MPFPPELQQRIDALKGNAAPDDELSMLKAKLAAREGIPGYSANTEALKARIEQIGSEPEESDNG